MPIVGNYFYLLLVVAALAGFFIALYIFHHKRRLQEKLICPLGTDCDTVIHSEYSRFLGMPLEILGMVYYGLIFLFYLILLADSILATGFFVFVVMAISLAAVLFSIYLTAIQAFLLKQWCTWCLISAGLCAIIFFSALFGSDFNFLILLRDNRLLIIMVHVLGVALGLGGATFTDILFFKFLKDFKISRWEASVLSVISDVIWFALVVLLVSGLGLYLPRMAELNQSVKFLTKMIIFVVILVNGFFLNILVSPRLVKISFGESHDHEAGELRRLRKAAFAMGAVSIVSWYSAFILGMIKSVPLSFIALFELYLLVLAIGVATSLVVEAKMCVACEARGLPPHSD